MQLKLIWAGKVEAIVPIPNDYIPKIGDEVDFGKGKIFIIHAVLRDNSGIDLLKAIGCYKKPELGKTVIYNY